jgi:hypothetical protein
VPAKAAYNTIRLHTRIDAGQPGRPHLRMSQETPAAYHAAAAMIQALVDPVAQPQAEPEPEAATEADDCTPSYMSVYRVGPGGTLVPGGASMQLSAASRLVVTIGQPNVVKREGKRGHGDYLVETRWPPFAHCASQWAVRGFWPRVWCSSTASLTGLRATTCAGSPTEGTQSSVRSDSSWRR